MPLIGFTVILRLSASSHGSFDSFFKSIYSIGHSMHEGKDTGDRKQKQSLGGPEVVASEEHEADCSERKKAGY